MGEVAAPPLSSFPYSRKLSGPQARMSDTWVASLLLFGLLAGLQQVSAREVKLWNFQAPVFVGQGLASDFQSPPSIVIKGSPLFRPEGRDGP